MKLSQRYKANIIALDYGIDLTFCRIKQYTDRIIYAVDGAKLIVFNDGTVELE